MTLRRRPFGAAASCVALTAVIGWAAPAGALTIDATFDSNVLNSGYASQIESAFAVAAQGFTSQISSNVAVNVSVDWSSQTYLGAAADTLAGYYNYSQIQGSLLSAAAANGISVTLPSSAPSGPTNYAVPTAEYKALTGDSLPGVTDAQIIFSSAYNWTFDPANGTAAGTYDFVSVAEHEIDHALGRIPGAFNATTPYRTPMDLFRYTAAGVLATTDTSADYLSLNGGVTDLQDLSTSSDTSDVTNTADIQTAYTSPGTTPTLTVADIAVLGGLGYALNATTVPEPASLALFGPGLAALPLVRRWKQPRLRQPKAADADTVL